MRNRLTRSVALSLSAAALAVVGWVPVAQSHEVHYSGRATAFNGTLTAAGVKKTLVLADVAMACTGTVREETTSTVSNPLPLGVHAKSMYAYTLGRNDESTARSSAEELNINLADGFTLKGTALTSEAIVRCDESTFRITKEGGSTFGSLVINGETYAYSGAPNETYEIPGVGKIVINEQLNPTGRELIVNALHITIADPSYPAYGDIVVGHSRAKLTCSR